MRLAELYSLASWLSRKDLPEDLGPIMETMEMGAGSERSREAALGFSTSFPKEFRAMNWLNDDEYAFEFMPVFEFIII